MWGRPGLPRRRDPEGGIYVRRCESGPAVLSTAERQRLFRSVPIASQTYDFLTQDDNAGYYDDADDDVLEHALIYAPHEHCSEGQAS